MPSWVRLVDMKKIIGVSVLAVLSIFVLAAPAADDSGYIRGRGKPTGAGLFVDGKYVGPAGRFSVPEKYAVAAGDHEIVLRDPRFEDFTTKLSVKPGKTTKFKYKLKPVEPPKPPFGRLRFGGGEAESFISVTAGDISPVYINEKFYGFLDELNNRGGGLLLPPGTYKLHCSSSLFGEINQDVTLTANKVTVVPLSKGK